LLIGLKAFYLKHLKGMKPVYYNPEPSYNKKVLIKIFDEYNIQAFRKPEFLNTFKQLSK